MGLASLLLAACLQAAEDKGAQVDLLVEDESWSVPKDLAFRARVTAITPAEPTAIQWRYGGEGLGGGVTRGTLAEKVEVGEWSPALPVASLVQGQFPRKLFLTFMVGRGGRLKPRAHGGGGYETEGGSTGVEMEFEFSFQGEAVKRFKEAGPDGGTVGIVIPAYRLAGGKTPGRSPARGTLKAFLDELSGLERYAARRAEYLESLPWAKQPVPRLFAVVTDVGGYGVGIYYGIRTTNKAVYEAECRSLRQLGVNGFRNAPGFLAEMAYERRGFAGDFYRIRDLAAMGYPVPRAAKGKTPEPEAGCPFAPGVPQRTKDAVEQAMELRKLHIDQVWGITVDEIGSVFDHAPEGKSHVALCPRCAEGFREYLKGLGLKPDDFARKTWAEIAPLDLWARPAPKPEPQPKSKDEFALEEAKPPAPRKEEPPARPAWQTDRNAALLAYHTSMFNNYASAKLFAPLRQAFAEANERKRGDPASPQPWLYSYALRGNTFLMGGHSLDFFDFYRLADNAFVYETSNRDARVWSWDSYLCDVGRVVAADQKLAFGIYVKPHRGAPIQRALAAVSRGVTMLYWYTYGPDYAKGDSFSQSDEALAMVSRAARLLGGAEQVLFGAAWEHPAEVAIVKPRSSEIWMRLAEDSTPWRAAWENAKWVYTALQHAHVPVDPLDEAMLATQDLSRYKVIYVNGPNLTRAAAAKLAPWAEAGGVLWTSGWGLARDEANEPLDALLPLLGLGKRNPPEMWYRVSLYGASSIETFDDPRQAIAPVPTGAAIQAAPPYGGGFAPTIGREVLAPAQGTEVLLRFADGSPAATRHRCGKGEAIVVGFFPGLEYSAGIRRHAQAALFDMSKDFDPSRRACIVAPALERVKPVADASQPTVEAILLRNAKTGRRAVTLMNWAYRVAAFRQSGKRISPAIEPVAFENIEVTIRGDVPRKVHSVALARELPVSKAADGFKVVLPRLEEGDVLLLE